MFLLAATSDSDFATLAGLAFLVAVIAAVIIVARQRESRSARRNLELHQQASRTHNDRETSAFQQHTELNNLAAQKFKREVELLDIQLQLAKFDLGMRHDHRDYHDLVMEKARLEIESLKLHIKEQRKRNDDFGSSDDH